MNILKTIIAIGLLVVASPLYSQALSIEEEIKRSAVIDSLEYNGEIDIDTVVELPCVSNCGFDTAAVVPLHSLYQIWLNNLINPYNVDLTTKPDTSVLDLSGYVPPIVNKINSDFGFRRWKFHYGIDIDIETGDSIRSAFDGMVRMATRGKRFGYYIVVRHYNGLETVYGHLHKNLVIPNQMVKAGEVVALGGNTGRSTGPHLHLEFRYLGQPINPHDIVDYKSEGQPLKSTSFTLSKATYDYVLEIRKIRYHVVRKGETLSHIAYRYGIPLSQIYKLNKLRKGKIIRPGQRIRYT